MDRIAWVHVRLESWAQWRYSSGGGLGGLRLYDENRVDQTADVRAGMVNLDPKVDMMAVDTDRAIAGLPDELKTAVVAYYTWDGGVAVMSVKLGITRATLHRRLCNADRRVAEWFDARERRSAEIRNNSNYATYT